MAAARSLTALIVATRQEEEDAILSCIHANSPCSDDTLQKLLGPVHHNLHHTLKELIKKGEIVQVGNNPPKFKVGHTLARDLRKLLFSESFTRGTSQDIRKAFKIVANRPCSLADLEPELEKLVASGQLIRRGQIYSRRVQSDPSQRAVLLDQVKTLFEDNIWRFSLDNVMWRLNLLQEQRLLVAEILDELVFSKFLEIARFRDYNHNAQTSPKQLYQRCMTPEKRSELRENKLQELEQWVQDYIYDNACEVITRTHLFEQQKSDNGGEGRLLKEALDRLLANQFVYEDQHVSCKFPSRDGRWRYEPRLRLNENDSPENDAPATPDC
jgi:hypothetical protein